MKGQTNFGNSIRNGAERMAKAKPQANGLYRYWYKGKQFWGKTEPEARQKRDRYKTECEYGIEHQDSITVFDLAQKWLPVAKAGTAPATYNQYATIMEKMVEVVGDKYVSAVTPADIKKIWMSFLGKSQSYINKASFLYKSFFQFAMENRYCAFNPALSLSAKPHKGTKGTHRALTKKEIQLVETVSHRVQVAAMFMLKAGLRRGEVLALTKADIHDERIWVTKAVKFVNNRPVIGSTKNESSERSVPLFAPLKPFIDGIENYVLPDADGELCSETAFQRAWEYYLKALSDAAGYPVSFRPHDLRHTFVTVCRDKGIDPHTVMSWCGHSSERMIMQIYDHLSEDREKKMIDMMDENY